MLKGNEIRNLYLNYFKEKHYCTILFLRYIEEKEKNLFIINYKNILIK